MLQNFDLTGRVGIVTGATGYLGAAMSRGLPDAGCRLIVTGQDENRARQAAAKLPGKGHMGLALNLEDSSSIDRVARTAESEMGRIDVLVNCAYRDPPAGLTMEEEWAAAFRIGVTGPYMLAEKVIQHLIKNGRPGSIINIGSIYGVGSNYPRDYDGLPVTSPGYYNALKGAVIALSKYMAVKYAKQGIRVNSVSPGCYLNDRLLKEMPEFCERFTQEMPMGRLGKPDEIRGMIVYLAGDASTYTTGQNFLVDGGWTAW